jgi:hypothetical protein
MEQKKWAASMDTAKTFFIAIISTRSAQQLNVCPSVPSFYEGVIFDDWNVINHQKFPTAAVTSESAYVD